MARHSATSVLTILILLLSTIAYFTYNRVTRKHRLHQAWAVFYVSHILTPEALSQACGTPERDVSGRLTKGDNIRDIHYRTSEGSEFVFRFLGTGSPIKWRNMGIWHDVTDPDGLGQLANELDVLQRMPCLNSNIPGSEDTVFKPEASGPAPNDLAAYQSPSGRNKLPSQPRPPLSPMPAPMPPPKPMPPPMPMPMPMPPPLSPNGPDNQPSNNTNGGGGKGADEQLGPLVIPCPGGLGNGVKQVCEVVGYAQFLSDLSGTIGGPDPIENLDALVAKLTGRDLTIVQLPALEADRIKVIKAIFELEIKVLNLISVQLEADMARLSPFKQDTPEVKAMKYDLIQRDERQRRELWRQGIEDSRPSRSTSEVTIGADSIEGSSGSTDDPRLQGSHIHMNENKHLQDALFIHQNGWRNQ